MKKRGIILTLLTIHCLLLTCYAQTPRKLIYADDFSKPLDPKTWAAEIEPAANTSIVYTKNRSLILDTKGGVTIWLNMLLSGNIQIEYDRQVLVDTGKNDRLSDLNQFWMATDPHNTNLFTRNGKFEAYDDLNLYYVGMGGNTNKTTRFRKYYNGQKPLIQEYLDKPHLLQANTTYHIKIVVNKGITSYWVNGECYFTYTDPAPLTSGYFGFRSTWSRQAITNFKAYQLQ
jgi:rhamnogalacturonan endolyase